MKWILSLSFNAIVGSEQQAWVYLCNTNKVTNTCSSHLWTSTHRTASLPHMEHHNYSMNSTMHFHLLRRNPFQLSWLDHELALPNPNAGNTSTSKPSDKESPLLGSSLNQDTASWPRPNRVNEEMRQFQVPGDDASYRHFTEHLEHFVERTVRSAWRAPLARSPSRARVEQPVSWGNIHYTALPCKIERKHTLHYRGPAHFAEISLTLKCYERKILLVSLK
jgi:hypothetical protein